MGDDTKIQHKIAQKCNTSKAYGLIKIHKQGFSVRPIISTINSPTYNLSKFFSQFLQSKLKKTKSHIDNSLELKLKIEKMKIPPGFEVTLLPPNEFIDPTCIVYSSNVKYVYSSYIFFQ